MKVLRKNVTNAMARVECVENMTLLHRVVLT